MPSVPLKSKTNLTESLEKELEEIQIAEIFWDRWTRRRAAREQAHPQSWRDFLNSTFPFLHLTDFAPHQIEFWDWVWAIENGKRPDPFVAIWSRGAAKSTSAELAATLVGITKRRAYIVYVSGTQDLANRHVQSIGGALEHAGIQRAVNRYGSARGWRRDQLRTDDFTIDAFGLDVGARGIRIDEFRPGLIVLDDVDELHDTAETTRKKIETITNTLLPAGANDCAVLFVQNLVHKDSVAARLLDGRADFLADRIISGAHPALTDFVVTTDIEGKIEINGIPTWAGQSLEDCRAFVRTWGLTAFKRECQHDVSQSENGLWRRDSIDKFRVLVAPELERIVIGVDPPGGKRTECGIVANGSARINNELHLYTLEDASLSGIPEVWGRAVVTLYHKLCADCIAAESNFGGEMVRSTIQAVDPAVNVKLVSASRGKVVRAEPIATMCEQGQEHHVGQFQELESEQCTWTTADPSQNRMDAHVWAATELIEGATWWVA